MARQDLLDRHRSSVLGLTWVFIQPLMLVVLFSTVFSHFMQARLGQGGDAYTYSLYLMAGVLPWNAFANVLGRMSSIYSQKAALISKVPVKLGLMPLYVVVTELVVLMLALGFVWVFAWMIGHPIGLSWLVVPLASILLISLAYVVGIILGMLDVFIPDIRNLIPIALQFGFWMTPIVYLPNILPTWAGQLIGLNPVYWAIEPLQRSIVFNQMADLTEVLWLFILTLSIGLLARGLLARLEPAIRDAL